MAEHGRTVQDRIGEKARMAATHSRPFFSLEGDPMYENKRCGKVEIKLNGPSQHVLDKGIGINWHHNWIHPDAPRDSSPDIDDVAHWDLLLHELDFLQPASIRFGYQSFHFVREDGSFHWGAEGFEALRRLDAWAKLHNADIIFDPWCIPAFWRFSKTTGDPRHDAAADPVKLAEEFVVPLLSHLVRDMGLSTVRSFLLMNEPLMDPNGSFLTPEGIDRFAQYIACHKAIFNALQTAGLPVTLIGPNTWSTLYWAVDHFQDRGLDLSPWIDAYDQHNYYSRFDYLPPNPTTMPTMPMTNLIDSQIAKNARFARMHGKRYYITELGTFYYGWSAGDPYGPATHEAFLTEAEFIIRSMNVGCGGFHRWAFLAPGEYQDGCWQFIDTVDGSYRRQPNTFYGYASLMRYSAPGSVIWTPEVEQTLDPYAYVHSVGLELSDGSHAVFVVNDHNCQERVVSLSLPRAWMTGKWQKILVDRTRKMHRRDIDVSSNPYEDMLPPMSLTVYTDKCLEDDNLLRADNGVQTKR